jgi:hypothetical protein
MKIGHSAPQSFKKALFCLCSFATPQRCALDILFILDFGGATIFVDII